MIKRFAVVGNPVAHSLSPFIHQHFARQTGLQLIYEKIQCDDSEFNALITDFFQQGGKGLNITLPFKHHAYNMAKNHTERCAKAKAANTLWMDEGQLHADNTDGVGLLRDLAHYCNLQNKKILILGAGGAARGIITPLLHAKIAGLWVANRTPEKVHALQLDFPTIQFIAINDLTGCFDVIINATAAGLTQNNQHLPAAIFSNRPFCYDLAYREHDNTPFVTEARRQNCQAVDGLGMLVEQAAEAFFIWHGVRPNTAQVLQTLRQSSKNSRTAS